MANARSSVRIQPADLTGEISAGESLLDAGLAAGVEMVAGCFNCSCGTCAVEVRRSHDPPVGLNGMTSRERIQAALRHQPVDRLPIDFGGTRQSGIAAVASHRLRRHLGLPERPTRVFDLFQMLAEVEQDLAERCGSDCLGLYRPEVAFSIRNADWKPWTLFDGTPVEVPGGFHPESLPNGDLAIRRGGEIIALMPKDGFYFDRLEKYPGAAHPDLGAWEPPRLAAESLDHLARQAEALFAGTDKAIIAPFGPPY
jgi:uroporphyrinogen decarboxylase